MKPSELRAQAIQFFQGITIDNEIVKKFIDYIKAYCADLKFTEIEILSDDKLFNNVYHLFDVVVMKAIPA